MGIAILHLHRHHVAVEIGDDPDRAGDDEKDDQYAEGEGENIVGAVGPAAQMQEQDEVNADLREGGCELALLLMTRAIRVGRSSKTAATRLRGLESRCK